jgi:diguanylate cyclase (GGDEF)-like protein
MDLISSLNKISKPVWAGVGVIVLCVVVFLDYITGVELSFSLFYLLPISIFSWQFGGKVGLAVAFLSAGIWLVVDIEAGAVYSSSFVYFWNTIIRIGFFLLPVFMIRLAKAMEREKVYARTDFLTGALNTRYFHELAQMEIHRSARYKRPFTIAFIDVDNFKNINDTFGHAMGDTVLRAIASNLQKYLRKTDLVARVGGDEFAVLLPEIDLESAPLVISNLQKTLLKEMNNNGWHVTLSIGVLTVTDSKLSVDELLGMADQLMYVVKNGSKNGIHYAAYPVETVAVEK